MGEPGVLASAKRSRKKKRQQALGKQQMDATVAQAVRRHVEQQEASRKVLQGECMVQLAQKAALRSAQEDLKMQQAAVMQKEKAFMSLMHTRKKEDAIQHAAMAWEVKDFSRDKCAAGSELKARKNRFDALRRVFALCAAMPPERTQTISNDFNVWDRCEESRYDKADSGSSQATRFSRILTFLLGKFQANQGEHVASWWEAEIRKFPPAPISLSAIESK